MHVCQYTRIIEREIEMMFNISLFIKMCPQWPLTSTYDIDLSVYSCIAMVQVLCNGFEKVNDPWAFKQNILLKLFDTVFKEKMELVF